MANTITVTNRTIEITAIDSDWLFSDTIDGPNLILESIQFVPVQTDDKCIIKDGGALGATIFEALCADGYDSKIKYFRGEVRKPFLDFSEGSFAAGTKIIIELK